jgi:nicotinamidase-related amidase
MRLPCDAALILIDLQQAIDDPRWGPRNNPNAEAAIAALLAAWRAQGLPIVHIRHDSTEPGSPYAPGGPGHSFKPEAAAMAGELVIGKSTNSAFGAPDLERALDAIGATTLVMAGVLTNNCLEASVRHGADLGYRIFVVADACWAVEKRDLSGRSWPAEDVHAMSLANMRGEYAQIVSIEMALRAAATATARNQRDKRRRAAQAPG